MKTIELTNHELVSTDGGFYPNYYELSRRNSLILPGKPKKISTEPDPRVPVPTIYP